MNAFDMAIEDRIEREQFSQAYHMLFGAIMAGDAWKIVADYPTEFMDGMAGLAYSIGDRKF